MIDTYFIYSMTYRYRRRFINDIIDSYADWFLQGNERDECPDYIISTLKRALLDSSLEYFCEEGNNLKRISNRFFDLLEHSIVFYFDSHEEYLNDYESDEPISLLDHMADKIYKDTSSISSYIRHYSDNSFILRSVDYIRKNEFNSYELDVLISGIIWGEMDEDLTDRINILKEKVSNNTSREEINTVIYHIMFPYITENQRIIATRLLEYSFGEIV